MRVVKMPGYVSGVEAYKTLNLGESVRVRPHTVYEGSDYVVKDKMLRIRVDSDFLSKLEYLKQINGFRTIAETVRKLLEKEYRKETEDER